MRTVVCIRVEHREVKVGALAHFVLENNLPLELPYADAGAIERQPLRLLLRPELVEYRRGRHRVVCAFRPSFAPRGSREKRRKSGSVCVSPCSARAWAMGAQDEWDARLAQVRISKEYV